MSVMRRAKRRDVRAAEYVADRRRTEPLVKRSRINSVSKKRAGMSTDRAALRLRVLERSPRCEAVIEPLCSYHATDVHEIKTRARGGSILDDDNCLALCRGCHRWITDNPKWALENGYVVHAWDGPAEMRAAERAREAWLYGAETIFQNAEEDFS